VFSCAVFAPSERVGVEAGFLAYSGGLSDFAGAVGVQAFILTRVLSVLPGFGGAHHLIFIASPKTRDEAVSAVART